MQVKVIEEVIELGGDEIEREERGWFVFETLGIGEGLTASDLVVEDDGDPMFVP